MPYIKPDRRYAIDIHLVEASHHIDTPGDLAYAITRLLAETDIDDAATGVLRGYTEHATKVGVLETVKLEWVRRIVSPYEDSKIGENGDFDTPEGIFYMQGRGQ